MDQVQDKYLEYLENLYQDKCCITPMDKALQSVIKELKEYRAIGTVKECVKAKGYEKRFTGYCPYCGNFIKEGEA